MSKLIRFGVSLESDLLEGFDSRNDKRGYQNRSEAIRDLIRECLIDEKIETEKGEVIGVVSLVFDHHKLELPKRLTEHQHKNHQLILSTLHVHLDKHNCLEVLLLKGDCGEIQSLAESLISQKGVLHGKLSITTTGEEIS